MNYGTKITPARKSYERQQPLCGIREALAASTLLGLCLGRDIQIDDSRLSILLLRHLMDFGSLLCTGHGPIPSSNGCGFNTNDMHCTHNASKEPTVPSTA